MSILKTKKVSTLFKRFIANSKHHLSFFYHAFITSLKQLLRNSLKFQAYLRPCQPSVMKHFVKIALTAKCMNKTRKKRTREKQGF